jgi:signal transduction histidine kinase
VLVELVTPPTNEVVKSNETLAGELLYIALLNAAGEQITNAVRIGHAIDLTELSQKDILQEGEHWGRESVTLVYPVDLGTNLAFGTNVILLPPRSELTNNPEGFRGRGFPHPENGPGEPPPPSGPPGANTNGIAFAGVPNPPEPVDHPPPPPHDNGARPHRPPRMWGMSEQDVQKRALHGLVLGMSTDAVQAASIHDLWLRSTILILATVSVFGSGLAWSNLVKTSDLQIRLVRASEMNSHLKEMNLAAAGLAHETRNPLNIIRGLAQMISKKPEAAPEIKDKSREIVEEADKVAAQLNEFINYSRPRELRPSAVALNSVVNDVVRTLGHDLEEKKIRLEVEGEPLRITADEQLLRQTLFNLLLNAIQAVDGDGEIRVVANRQSATEARLEIRDNGPGVPAESRTEIFKPYFTTQKTGTGLGLAVVQQIVLAHGWEIGCLPNEPKGAVFRLTHLKLAS